MPHSTHDTSSQGAPPFQGWGRDSSAHLAVHPATADPPVRERAAQLADQLHLPLTPTADPAFDLLLTVTPARLELRDNAAPASRPLFIDFVGGPLGRHRCPGRLEPQRLLFKAIGSAATALTILDATAGLGRDAFLLAAKGHRVTAVERSAGLVALLSDAIDRAAQLPRFRELFQQRFRLIHADARQVMAQMAQPSPPDVIYLDPMLPPKKKSALVKKQMRLLRRLVGDDLDAADLFTAARAAAPRRIVVKRLRHSPPIAPNPAHSLTGKSTRFDVYHP